MNEATARQLKAADPARSTWLTANAGSGKTRVLTRRVARLLLTGVEPQRILCLTYTKAAASEMQNRLFATLGDWAMRPEARLRDALAEIGEGGALSADDLAHARTLFARAIETPGGLKIQTIHAFCASVLRRFPLEAGVAPDFREMDQRLARMMQRDIIEEMAEGGSDGLQAMAAHQTSDDIGTWIDDVLRHKVTLAQPLSREEIWSAMALPPGYGLEDLRREVFGNEDPTALFQDLTVLRGSSTNDQKLIEKLVAIDVARPTAAGFAALEDALVYDGSRKNPFTPKAVPTKRGKDLLGPALLAAFDAFKDRVAGALPRRRALAAAELSWALHAFAAEFLPAYDAKKAAGGWLDFDDLIIKTQALLTEREMAAWVLFRLDGGIDHILVDEAQDTSPAQWQIIRSLAEEFLSGDGSRADTPRSLFVVGDKKQSIYSFQGADPQAFDGSQAHFDGMLAEGDAPLQTLSLRHSFRSAPAILRLVDEVFAQNGQRGLGDESEHVAFKDALPGRVDVLTPFPKDDTDTAPWYKAVDEVTSEDAQRRLAKDIALRIEAMIGTAQIPIQGRGGPTQRPVEPKDILILVQRRSDVFAEIIRACKARNIPLAGADQMNIAQELAVRDLTALLSFLSTPEDNLSLASTLKSPLFGWDERALFDLAHHRTGALLWPALRAQGAAHGDTVERLQDLLAHADFLRPFELLERVLTRQGGRRALVARLGVEAEDAIDALLAQALAYEQTETPSLAGFLTWLSSEEFKIKRAIDTSANVVRVMTAHGAKGLEAPIVILPDTAERNAPQAPKLEAADQVYWLPKPADKPAMLEALTQKSAEKALDERQRLLYVALTRAECWLIVAAANKATDPEKSWFAQIAAAQEALGPEEIPGGRRYEPQGWPEDVPPRAPQEQAALELAPLDLPAVAPSARLSPLSPSQLGGAKTLEETDADPHAVARGVALHRLLEVLPGHAPSDWAAIADGLPLDAGLNRADLLQEASQLLESETLKPLFSSESLAEVEVTARLPSWGGRPLRGTIDRLIVAPERILAIDFKSNRVPPAEVAQVPEGILRQMGAYAQALAQIYPNRPIETAILWTRSATLMTLPHQAVMAALDRALTP